jgi:hypothetical protein
MDLSSHLGHGLIDSGGLFAPWDTLNAMVIIQSYISIEGHLLLLWQDMWMIVITRYDEEEIKRLKENLGRTFEVKDLGPLRYFLGIERSSTKRKYVLDLLAEIGILGCRPRSTPIDINHQISAESGGCVDKETYQRLVGRLIYLCHT